MGLQGISESSGVALDPLNGNLFVGNLSGRSAVAVYRAGSVNPAYGLRNTQFADFLGMGVIRHTEYLMVPASQSNTITFFKHNARKPSFTVTLPRADAYGVALKPAGVP